MKHIAIITTGLVGITNASIKLAERLRNEGHRITFLAPIDIKEKLSESDFEFAKLPEINFQLSLKQNLIPRKNHKTIFHTYLYYYTHIKRVLQDGVIKLKLEEYEKILKAIDPELVIVDMEIHEAVLTSLKLNIKTHLLSAWFYIGKQQMLPPIELDITPGKGIIGSYFGIELSWIKLKIKVLSRALARKILLRSNRKSVLFYYKKIHGLKYLKTEIREFPSDFIYTNISTLNLVMPELEFPFKKPPSTYYLGALVPTIIKTAAFSTNILWAVH